MALFSWLATNWLLVVLGLVPAMIWGGLFFMKDRKHEPKKLVALTFAAGMASALPILAYRFFAGQHPETGLEYILQQHIHSAVAVGLVFYLIVAIVEEYLKHVAMIIVVERNLQEFDQIVDGIVYGVAAAMGFAFLENIVYLDGVAHSVLALVFISRALGATFGHAIFSGTFGYAYGKAVFTRTIDVKTSANPVWDFHKKLGYGLGLHILRTHILAHRGKLSKVHTRAELLAEGYWTAVWLHFLYDVIAGSLAIFAIDFSVLAPLLICFAGYRFLRFFADPANQRTHQVALEVATIPEFFLPTKHARTLRRKLGLSPGL